MLNRKSLCQIHFHLSNHILFKEKNCHCIFFDYFSFIQKGINTLVKMKFKRLLEIIDAIPLPLPYQMVTLLWLKLVLMITLQT